MVFYCRVYLVDAKFLFTVFAAMPFHSSQTIPLLRCLELKSFLLIWLDLAVDARSQKYTFSENELSLWSDLHHHVTWETSHSKSIIVSSRAWAISANGYQTNSKIMKTSDISWSQSFASVSAFVVSKNSNSISSFLPKSKLHGLGWKSKVVDFLSNVSHRRFFRAFDFCCEILVCDQRSNPEMVKYTFRSDILWIFFGQVFCEAGDVVSKYMNTRQHK